MINEVNLDLFKDFLTREPNVPLRELEIRERDSGFPIIKRGVQDLLRVLMTTVSPKQILELGCGVGFSSILMAYYAPQAHITTVELKEKNIVRAEKNISDFKLEDRIEIIPGDAEKVLESGEGIRDEYDFIFVDCAKAQYIRLWDLVRNRIRPGGIILTDDILQNESVVSSRFLLNRRQRTTHKRMREYLHAQFGDVDFTAAVFEIDDGISLAVRNSEG